MQRIIPSIWLEKDAWGAGEYYGSVFAGTKTKNVVTINDTPSGTAEIAAVEVLGHTLTLLAAGPIFKPNPSISFLVSGRTAQEIEGWWQKLLPGGTTLMELGVYPFAEKYGWVQDRYGVSWQLIYRSGREMKQRITPTLMFTGKLAGKAEEAIAFYASVFPQAKIGEISRYGKDTAPDREGTIAHAEFSLAGQEFAAMDSAHPHNFAFSEAISLEVHCQTQEEIDRYWERLSADLQAEQCGWLKDKYGVSWQIVPDVLEKMLADQDPAKKERVTAAFLKMKKFDLKELQRAYAGK